MVSLEDIELEALENDVPIMDPEGLDFMIDQLKEHHATSLLEIGTAVGYSASMMVTQVDHLCIDSIERDHKRFLEAKKNVEALGLEESIHLFEADALEFNNDDLTFAPYDCLFIDAAKAQYQKFFEKYIDLVKEDGFVIVDNLDFHGMIYDIPHIKNRNTRALVRKIKRFKDWIFNNDAYEVTYYGVGDGICIITRKD